VLATAATLALRICGIRCWPRNWVATIFDTQGLNILEFLNSDQTALPTLRYNCRNICALEHSHYEEAYTNIASMTSVSGCISVWSVWGLLSQPATSPHFPFESDRQLRGADAKLEVSDTATIGYSVETTVVLHRCGMSVVQRLSDPSLEAGATR